MKKLIAIIDDIKGEELELFRKASIKHTINDVCDDNTDWNELDFLGTFTHFIEEVNEVMLLYSEAISIMSRGALGNVLDYFTPEMLREFNKELVDVRNMTTVLHEIVRLKM